MLYGLILLGVVIVALLVPLSYWLDIPRQPQMLTTPKTSPVSRF